MNEPSSDSTLPGTPPPVADDPALTQTLRDSAPGRVVFGRFRLVRELGAGGMGVVWLAEDERLRYHRVALKFLSGIVARDPEALEDLQREIALGLQLTHAGVVRLYDLHHDPGAALAAIAMEWVDGPTLAEEKARQPGRCFDLGQPLISWITSLSEVFTYVHEEAGVIHRDLKPRNVMLTKEGKLKVADFGLSAMLCDSRSRVSQQPGCAGTPAYMSPQQAQGCIPSVADDIYAFGATLFELLTSKPPFYRGGSDCILHQAATVTPPLVSERRREFGLSERAAIPRDWEETIASCLAKQPQDRPGSMRELRSLLGWQVNPHTRFPLPRREAKSSATPESQGPRGESAPSASPPSGAHHGLPRGKSRDLASALPGAGVPARAGGGNARLALCFAGVCLACTLLYFSRPRGASPPPPGSRLTGPVVVPSTPLPTPATSTPPPRTTATPRRVTPGPATPPPFTPPRATPPLPSSAERALATATRLLESDDSVNDLHEAEALLTRTDVVALPAAAALLNRLGERYGARAKAASDAEKQKALYEDAIRVFARSFDSGDWDACVALGLLTNNVLQKPEAARLLFHKAAELGNRRSARYLYGASLWNSSPDAATRQEARTWLQRAREEGDADAAVFLREHDR